MLDSEVKYKRRKGILYKNVLEGFSGKELRNKLELKTDNLLIHRFTGPLSGSTDSLRQNI